jgi:DNA-binding LacI/PurR family transcriptional regulator
MGHRRIAYANFRPIPRDGAGHYSEADRPAGYEAAMREAGLEPRFLCPERPIAVGKALDVARSWLASPARPTALLVYSFVDYLHHVALGMGLRVPGDLSVVTFADQEQHSLGLSLTTALVPVRQMGEEAVGMLIEKTREPRRPLPARVIPFGFSPGGTTGPPASRRSRRWRPAGKGQPSPGGEATG